MKYMVKESINRQIFNCDPNTTLASFTECAFNNIEDHGCSVAINNIGNLFNETKFCKNESKFQDVVGNNYQELSDFLHPKNESQPKCIRPCRTVEYEISLQKKNENGKLLLKKEYSSGSDGAFLLGFKYDDLVKDTKQEYLVMDGPGLVSTVGGFLGLFLGSSCVSIIEWFMDRTKRFVK